MTDEPEEAPSFLDGVKPEYVTLFANSPLYSPAIAFHNMEVRARKAEARVQALSDALFQATDKYRKLAARKRK